MNTRLLRRIHHHFTILHIDPLVVELDGVQYQFTTTSEFLQKVVIPKWCGWMTGILYRRRLRKRQRIRERRKMFEMVLSGDIHFDFGKSATINFNSPYVYTQSTSSLYQPYDEHHNRINNRIIEW